MKNETKIWQKYAAENLESAKILLQSNLHNPWSSRRLKKH